MKNSFLQFFRGLRKDRFLTITKVFGLGIGFLVFIITTQFVQHQRSFDSIHQKKDRIYRVNLLGSFEEIAGTEMGVSHYKIKPILDEGYPEVEQVVRLFDSGSGYGDFNGERAFYDRALFVDSTFFKIFDFKLTFGQKEITLTTPNSVLISEEMSRQLFRDENPIGKPLTMQFGSWLTARTPQDPPLIVSGVFQKEEDSHLQFDVLTSFKTKHQLENVNWSGPVANTYVLLNQGASEETLNTKLESFYAEHHPNLEKMYQPVLQSLGSIHLDSANIKSDRLNWQKFDRKYIKIFTVLSLLVLLIAVVNFIQLSVGQLSNRMKSTAIRKLTGATDWDILSQYYFETAMLCITSVLIAFIGLQGLAPLLNNQLGLDLSINDIFSYGAQWIILTTVLVIIIVTGFVPVIIGHFTPAIATLSGRTQAGGRGLLSKGLIVIQLAMGFGLLGGSIVVFNQTDYLLANNDSFEQDFILQIPLSEEAKKKYLEIKQDMEKLPGVENVTAASNQFGTIGGLDLKLKVDGAEKILILPTLMVDTDFLEFYDIEIKEGRNFGEWGQAEFIVNQAMVDNFGWEEPIGQQIGFAYGKPGKVVGVVDNFNYNSLHEEVEPFCFWSTNYLRFISVKIATSDPQALFTQLDASWATHVSDKPFSYTFLDDDVEKMYKAEVITNSVVKYLTLIAILLASLGIYALSLLVSQRKTKEVSIRKVLGAPVSILFGTYSWQFYKLILLSLLLVTPLVYLVMKDWLANFAYTDGVPTLMLIMGCVTMLVISTVALLSNLLRLVLVNPVISLREQ